MNYNHSFAYDGAGNPTSWAGTARTFDAGNQETTGGNFGWNGDGTPWLYLNRNRLSATGTAPRSEVYSYTSDGQLMQINAHVGGGAAGAAIAGYGYRADGLRAWKQDASGNRTFFYYEGGQLLAIQGQTTASTRSTLMLWGADGLIGYRWTDAGGISRSRYHLYDAQGNLAQALDEAGTVVETAGVTAWGAPLVNGSAFGVSSSFGYGAKFGYFRDGESGFYLCGFRYYDPSAGRWITRDPIEYAGGANLYGYVDNDAANVADPSGLWAPAAGAPAAGAAVSNPVGVSIGVSAAATYGIYILSDAIALRYYQARGASLPAPTRAEIAAARRRRRPQDEFFERFGSKDEANACLTAQKLLPRPAPHQNQPKWIAELGVQDPRRLSQNRNNRSYRIIIQAQPASTARHTFVDDSKWVQLKRE